MTKRRGGIVLWIVFMAVALIFCSGAIAVYTVFMKPENQSKVPALTGKSLVEAAADAEKLGLVVQVESVASTLQDGKVLAQSPESGTELRKGQVIVLQVARSGELHTVPDVQGKTLTEAQSLIKENGFTLGDVIKVRESGIEAGIVIAQSPSSPAEVNAGRKIDLLVQDGAASDGTVTIPDVNRMTESEARNLLETSGIKVSGVDRVYSPLLPEGLAIETRPTAGNLLRVGGTVILKLATQKRPAGFMDNTASSNANKTTANNNKTNTASTAKSASTTSKTTPTTAATKSASTAATPKTASTSKTTASNSKNDEFIGDDYTASSSKTQASSKTQSASKTQTTSKTQSTASTSKTPTPAAQSGNKTARIRYVVPPIAQPMNLRIEVTDPSGKRDIMNKQVKGGDSVSATAKYSSECMVSIYLGGQSVWQERYR